MKSQVGRGGVDGASSSDARGLGFKPRPLNLENTTSLPWSRIASLRSRALAQISELSKRGGVKPKKSIDKKEVIWSFLFLAEKSPIVKEKWGESHDIYVTFDRFLPLNS